MFTPDMLTVPIFYGLGSGVVLSPSVGAGALWMLIGAFVSCSLGLLWEGFRARPRSDKRTPERPPVSLPLTRAAAVRW